MIERLFARSIVFFFPHATKYLIFLIFFKAKNISRYPPIMPPRAKRTRPTERRAATPSIRADSDAKPNGIFHFVSVNPSSELQKSENRSVIRSHASKYIWRQHRAGRTEGSNPNSSIVKPVPSPKDPLSLISPTGSNGTANERLWPLTPDTIKAEEALSVLSPPDESNTSPSEDEDMVDSEEVSPEVENFGSSRNVTQTQYPSNAQSAQSSMAAAADIYEHESDTIAGPFNQLMTFIGEPANQFPSMLGGSAISKLMRYGKLYPPSFFFSFFLQQPTNRARASLIIFDNYKSSHF